LSKDIEETIRQAFKHQEIEFIPFGIPKGEENLTGKMELFYHQMGGHGQKREKWLSLRMEL
jgi:hypothetical protein